MARFPEMIAEPADDLAAYGQAIDRTLRARAMLDFRAFYPSVIIPAATGPRILNDCIASFQRGCFEDLAPSLHALRDGTLPPKRRFWIERTKKASKDSDLGIVVAWLMAVLRRPFLIQITAANQKQAGIIKARIEALLYYNDWLDRYLRLVQNRIYGITLGGALVQTVIEATGTAGGAHGETPGLLILNELVHVDRWSVMETHRNNADGVPQGVVIISTNAGVKGTPAEVWRKEALTNRKRWSCHIFSGIAPWLDKEDVQEAQRLDPLGMEFKRLWRGLWISGTGGAVSEEGIQRCFSYGHEELAAPEEGWVYTAGLDLGINHDHAGLVVLGTERSANRLRIGYIRGWIPSLPNDQGVLEVDSEAVENQCVALHRLFRIVWFGYDPAAGGSFMAQRLRRRGIPMVEVSFSSPSAMTQMAKCFVVAVQDGKLECYEDPEGRLRRDFGKFSILHRPPSFYRLEAVSDEFGHADVGTGLLICLPKAMEMLRFGAGLLPSDSLGGEPETLETRQADLDSLPEEFRELYNLYDAPSRNRLREDA